MGLTISPLHVRRAAWIQAAPERVWQEFETLDRLKGWFGIGHEIHRFDLEVGGAAELSVEPDGERRYFGGAVLVLEPGQELSFESNWHAPHAWPVPTVITIRLTPFNDGTQVEIYHHGFERLGEDAADLLEGYEAGWDNKHLRALRAVVESR